MQCSITSLLKQVLTVMVVAIYRAVRSCPDMSGR